MPKKDRSGGKDAPFYKGGGGRIQPSPGYSADDGFGTPPEPGRRGEPFGGDVPTDMRTPSRNTDFDQFRKKGGRK